MMFAREACADAVTSASLSFVGSQTRALVAVLKRPQRLESRAGALTNFEVLDLLRSRGAGKDPTRVIASVLPSEFKVFDYLEQTAACNQTRDIIKKLVDECKKYDLAKAEILNVANIRPSSAVEVYTMIEECETRLEDKIDDLVETIVQILPPHPSQVESNEEKS